MELLVVFDDEDEAREAESKITGPKRLASDRDDNQVVWHLFGIPSWANFYALDMYDLPQLKELLDKRKAGQEYNAEEHQKIILGLGFLVNSYQLKIPDHWL